MVELVISVQVEHMWWAL